MTTSTVILQIFTVHSIRQKNMMIFRCMPRLSLGIGSPLLDVACGDGRVAVQLARQGQTVFSFDKSRTILELFKQSIVKLLPEDQARIHIVRSEMQNIPFKNHFKLAIIPYNSFNHLMKKGE